MTENGMISMDSWHQLMGEKAKEMKSFLSNSLQTLSTSNPSYRSISFPDPSIDSLFLFSILSDFLRNELLIGPEGVSSIMSQSDHLAGQFVDQSLEHLQKFYFLPPLFSNTTFGALAVQDSVQYGYSDILQRILRLPSVRSILVESVKNSFVNDEHISKMEIKEDAEFAYLEKYNRVKSSNATLTIQSLLRSGLLRLQVLHPIFCPNGWTELIPALYLAPHNIVNVAYMGMEEEMGKVRVMDSLRESQRKIMKHRESFLREYYAKQLESEYLVLKAIAGEYKSFLTDSFSVEDWLQGLIQVGSENGFHSSWEVCARIFICMHKCW